jgi:hypothetical protein
MRERRRATINELRVAVECLPRHTRVAMLEGIRSNEIIVGAYTNGDGICPMLAAHRAGGRTDFISFARAWDRFAFRGARRSAARRATERELLILKTHLEASLIADDGPAPDLKAALADHRELVQRRAERGQTDERARPHRRARAEAREAGRLRERRVRPGDPDRSRELRGRPGWAWTRIFRRYDDYERALARIDAAAARHEQPEHELV